MKTSVRDAAAETGVHRSTLYKWVGSKRLVQDEKGKVDTVVIRKLKAEKKTGRNYGPINRGRGQTDKGDPETEFSKALTHFAGIVDSLPAEKRRQVLETIRPKLPEGEAAGSRQDQPAPPDVPADQEKPKPEKKAVAVEPRLEQGDLGGIFQSSESKNPNPRKMRVKPNRKSSG